MNPFLAVAGIFLWVITLFVSYIIVRVGVRDGIRDAMSKKDEKTGESWMDKYP